MPARVCPATALGPPLTCPPSWHPSSRVHPAPRDFLTGWGTAQNRNREALPVPRELQDEDPKGRRDFIQEVKMLLSDPEVLPSLCVINRNQPCTTRGAGPGVVGGLRAGARHLQDSRLPQGGRGRTRTLRDPPSFHLPDRSEPEPSRQHTEDTPAPSCLPSVLRRAPWTPPVCTRARPAGPAALPAEPQGPASTSPHLLMKPASRPQAPTGPHWRPGLRVEQTDRRQTVVRHPPSLRRGVLRLLSAPPACVPSGRPPLGRSCWTGLGARVPWGRELPERPFHGAPRSCCRTAPL